MTPDFNWDEAETTGQEPEVSPSSQPPSIEDYDVAERVQKHLGHEDWDILEVLLSSHATMLIGGDDSTHGIIIEGQPSSGKTTLLKLLWGLHRQIFPVNRFTPKSLLSGYAEFEEEEAEEKSLLAMTRGKTLVTKDMGPYFEGDPSDVRERWSTLADAMDGGTYKKVSGTLGEQTVDDVHFNFLGAVTPLEPSDHQAMGNVGPRLLIVSKSARTTDQAKKSAFNDGLEYNEKVDLCRGSTQEFLTDLWNDRGGVNGVNMPSAPKDPEVEDVLGYLTDLVRHTRSGEEGEGPDRVLNTFKDLARGHALIYGREEYGIEDLDVCVRAALGSIQGKFEPVIRLLLRRASNGEPVTRAEVEDKLDVSKKTALNRMEEMERWELVEITEMPVQGGPTKAVEVPGDVTWPEEVFVP